MSAVTLPPYEDRIIAFLDILGFSDLINRLDGNPELHGIVHHALSLIRHHKYRANDNAPVLVGGVSISADLEVSVFSDSIAISSAIEEKGMLNCYRVFTACGWLQAELLYLGILTRGGISKGKTYHRDDLLYGDGMLNAYRLESRAAIYPRILIDSSLFDMTTNSMRGTFFEEDSDGLFFINPFHFDAFIKTENLAGELDGRQLYFDRVGHHIEQGIQESKHSDHFAKWTWLQKRYIAASDEYSLTGVNQNQRIFEYLSENGLDPYTGP